MHHTCTCTCLQGTCTCSINIAYKPHSLYLTLRVNLHTCGCHEAIEMITLAYKQTPWRVAEFIYKLQEILYRGEG